MKKFLFIGVVFFSSIISAFSQTKADSESASSVLTEMEVERIFTQAIRKKFSISYPIWRVYNYSDASGTMLLVLSESADSVLSNGKDTVHHHIKAINFQKAAVSLTKQWEVNDFILQNKGASEEFSIWFWTRYSTLTDIDKDGFIDPVIVYGTSGTNGYDDGRIKIIVFHKGKKIAIRHQNSILDKGRNTLVDASFYTMPPLLQAYIQQLMQQMADNEHAVFQGEWIEALKKKQLKL
jgi:hypothetical protein